MKRFLSLCLALIVAVGICLSAPMTIEAEAATYQVNGVTIPVAGYEVGKAHGNCWEFAQDIYNKLWPSKGGFSSARGTSDDMLRNVSTDSASRAITVENTKKFISSAALGSVVRVCSMDYMHGGDGWGHSFILVQKDANGFTAYQGNYVGKIALTYYTWNSYVSEDKNYNHLGYFKYIKWPGAPAFGTSTSGSQTSINWVTGLAGEYFLVGKSTNAYLSISEDKNASGQPINTWGKWWPQFKVKLTAQGNGYKIQFPEVSSLILNADGDSLYSGSKVNILKDVNDSTQWWGFEKVGDAYVIRNLWNPNLVLTDNGVNQTTITTYTGAKNQLWYLHPYVSGKVEYNANGGTGAPSSQTKYYNTTLTLSSTVPTRAGYTFKGWGTSASDTTVDYAPGATYTREEGVTLYAIWKCNHTLGTTSVINKKSATCTADGYTGDTYCSTCKTTIAKGTVIKAKGHTEVTVKGKAATCTATGLTDGKKCSVCGTPTVAQQTIKATGHKEVVIPAVAPTYTTVGKTEGRKCSVCGKVTVAQKDVAKLILSVPVVKVANASNGVKVTWNKVANAEKYIVYSSSYNTKTKKWSGWTNRGTTTKTTWTDTKVKSGTQYKYTVRAVSGSVKSEYKSSSSILFLAQPTVKIANNASGVKVAWNKITGAQGYTIYRAEYKNGKWSSWKNMGTIKKNATVSWVDKSAKSGTTYRYTVRAVNGSVKSTYAASNTLLYLAQPKTTVKAVSNGINVSWTQSTGATGYTIYRMEYNAKTKKWSGWKNMGTTKKTAKSWTDKSAKKGVTYKYTVKAVNGKTASTYKASGSVKR